MSADIKTLIFDWGGVCCTPAEPFASRRLQEAVGKPPDDIAASVQALLDEYYLGKCTRDQFWTSVIGALQLAGFTPDELSGAYLNSYSVRPEVLATIRQLRRRYRVVLLSNLTPEMVEDIRRKHEVETLFEKCFFSCEIGAMKPGDQAFDAVRRHLGASPEECVFVDDSPANVQASRRLGYAGVLFEGYPALLSSLLACGIRLLFLPNNHSIPDIDYSAPAPEAAAVVRRLLGDEYRLGDVTSVRLADRQSRHSRNYRVVAGGREILFRSYGATHTRASLGLSHSLLRECAARGARVPTFLTLPSGETLLERDGFHAVFQFVDGTHFGGTRGELRCVAREIGRLHRVLAGLSAPLIEQFRNAPPPEYARIPLRMESLETFARLAAGKESVFEAATERLLPTIRTRSAEALARRAAFESLPKQVIHSDLHPHNVLMDGQELRCVLDFDAARWDYRARDAAFALARLVRQHIVRTCPDEPRAAVREAVRIFLEAYEEETVLTPLERGSLRHLMLDEVMQKIHYVLDQHFLRQERRFDDELPKLAMLLEEADFLAEVLP